MANELIVRNTQNPLIDDLLTDNPCLVLEHEAYLLIKLFKIYGGRIGYGLIMDLEWLKQKFAEVTVFTRNKEGKFVIRIN